MVFKTCNRTDKHKDIHMLMYRQTDRQTTDIKLIAILCTPSGSDVLKQLKTQTALRQYWMLSTFATWQLDKRKLTHPGIHKHVY